MESTKSIIGYLGPEGTFTQQALLGQTDLATKAHMPFRTVPDVLEAVENGVVEFGFVPIENSIEGTVNYTQDALVFDHDLLIQREAVLDIELCLLAKADVTLEQIQQVYSMPVATAQCHGFLRKTLNDADIRVANSTAEAAKTVGES
jgi:prephenate dehydratase